MKYGEQLTINQLCDSRRNTSNEYSERGSERLLVSTDSSTSKTTNYSNITFLYRFF